MKRRTILQCGLWLGWRSSVLGNLAESSFEQAAEVLRAACDLGEIDSATVYRSVRGMPSCRFFGKAVDENAMYLLGSISKPIAIAALMTLFDQGQFQLEDRVAKYLPSFTGDGREAVTMRHLMTHVSGLPDQLPENDRLRAKHATLDEFAEHAVRTPLLFAPGTRYSYSSMGILLASQVAERLSGLGILRLVERAIFQPLGMSRSAQGLGHFALEEMILSQTERAAPESGGGNPAARDWDWNSPYWRRLGAPWGGSHASAPDLAKLLAEFLNEEGRILKPVTARWMISNQNAAGLTPRGLGWNVGRSAGGRGCSESSFGHTGSTGTIAWGDRERDTICIILTSLPAAAVPKHPRDVAAEMLAKVG